MGHTWPPKCFPPPRSQCTHQTPVLSCSTDGPFENTLVGVYAPNIPSVLENTLRRARFVLSYPWERAAKALPQKHLTTMREPV